MTKKPITNLAASVRQRLLNQARAEQRAFQELAQLYAMERFLFRLAASEYADQFVLKGGMMTLTWAGEYARVTRDIDLLGRGTNSIASVVERIGEVLRARVEDDGVFFDIGSVSGAEIAVNATYVGVRVAFAGTLAGMALDMRVDVGFGDAVVPPPTWFEFPQLLDLGAPRLLGYPPAATIAEKLHAVCVHGLANSRMKDYYDFWTAHRLGICSAEDLARAVRHTFERRQTGVPMELPVGLTAAFATDRDKVAQWTAFVGKVQVRDVTLADAVAAGAALARAAFGLAS